VFGLDGDVGGAAHSWRVNGPLYLKVNTFRFLIEKWRVNRSWWPFCSLTFLFVLLFSGYSHQFSAFFFITILSFLHLLICVYIV
jgi:hypothetical protein